MEPIAIQSYVFARVLSRSRRRYAGVLHGRVDGEARTTSPIVKVEGNLVTTRSGSVYVLSSGVGDVPSFYLDAPGDETYPPGSGVPDVLEDWLWGAAFDPYAVGKTQAADAPMKADRVMIYDRLSWTDGVTDEDYATFFRGFTDGLFARLGYAVTLEIETENHGRDWYWIRRTE